MEINNELIDKLAKLSKLEFKGKEKEDIKADLTKMLGFVEKLNEVNTNGVEPLEYLTEGYQTLRRDQVSQSINQQQALSNAPEKDSDYIKVPKVSTGRN